jgi:excisionase family DNA binding protein
MEFMQMSDELKQVADMVTANIIHCTKEVLTSDEAARYLGISKSYLYKMTMQQKIPHYKPMGKMCYFNRVELEQWLQSNRVATDEEISQKAQQINEQRKEQNENTI